MFRQLSARGLCVCPTDLTLSCSEAPHAGGQSGAPAAAEGRAKTHSGVCSRRDAVHILDDAGGSAAGRGERPAASFSVKLGRRFRLRGKPIGRTQFIRSPVQASSIGESWAFVFDLKVYRTEITDYRVRGR